MVSDKVLCGLALMTGSRRLTFVLPRPHLLEHHSIVFGEESLHAQWVLAEKFIVSGIDNGNGLRKYGTVALTSPRYSLERK